MPTATAARSRAHVVSASDIEARRVNEATGLVIEAKPHKRTPWERRLVATWTKSPLPEWDWSLGICKGCASDIDTSPTCADVLGVQVSLPSSVCEECATLARAHYNGSAAEEEVTETPKWDRECPPRHRAVVLGEVRPKEINWSAYERALQWTPQEGRGLIMVGRPGAGKTSAFWALARKLELDGVPPVVLGSLELAEKLRSVAKGDIDVGWLYRCRVLMVDDIGKERPTPGVSAELWRLLDKRLAFGLPSIFTTQFDGNSMARRFGARDGADDEKDLGDAIRRRISQMCRMIAFSPDDKSSDGSP